MNGAWPSVAQLGATEPASGALVIRPGVVLNEGQAAFVHALRAVLPPEVPLTVNSGTRTAEAQASAMIKKWQAAEANRAAAVAAGKPPTKTGDQELHDIYGDDAAISALLALPREVGVWAGQIAAWAASGRTLSRHQRGDAVDLHTATLPLAQRDALIAAAKSLGARTLLESAPPHLHVDLPPAFAGTATAAARDEAAAPVETFPADGWLLVPAPAPAGVPWWLLAVGAAGAAWFAWPVLAPVVLPLLTRAAGAAIRVVR